VRLEVPRPGWDDLTSWCERHLNSPPTTQLFEQTHLSSVLGLRLADGREVVVKARFAAPRLDDCFRIHRYLWLQGYPSAEPLVAPAPFGRLIASAETLVPGGDVLVETPGAPRLFADALHCLIAAAAGYDLPFDLSPPLPWVGWEHGEAGIWPNADDLDDDLNAMTEPGWLDEMGAALRKRLLADAGPRVIGHGDWWQPNIRWRDGALYCVHDWDSLVYLSEAAIAGAASASFSVVDWGATTVEESEAFLESYADVRGRPWSAAELEIAWAAGLWQLAFNAKKDILGGVRSNIDHLERYGAERMRRAGC
jgi:hypothetical protein